MQSNPLLPNTSAQLASGSGMLLAVRKSKLPATALPQSKQRYARLAHGLRKCSGKQCGQPDEERYASRLAPACMQDAARA